MLIIGERINSSRKPVANAIAAGDADFIRNEAVVQTEAGADFIDVNAAAFLGEELDRLKWLIDTVQSVTDTPLSIDSPAPAVIREAVPALNRPPMINSITLEPSRLEGILPLIADHHAKVIGLCQSQNSMAETTEAKVEMAGHLVEKVTSAGIPVEDLYIDPLVYPLGADHGSASATLDAIQQIMKQFPGVHTCCGLTNVSHGLPVRKLVNRTFLVMCVGRGLDSAILDPTDKELYSALRAALMVAGKDDFCVEYMKAFRKGHLA